MRNVVVLVALLSACITTSLKAQSLLTNLQFINNNNQLALNYSSIKSAGNYTSINNTSEAKTPAEDIIEPIERLSPLQIKYAMMLDVELESLNNSILYLYINEWFGTKYRMGGTTKKGIDCSAFTGNLLSSVYSFCMPRTAREQYKICENINKDELMAGDLVFFNTRGGVSHVGVYLTNNRFVHSSSSQGVVISNLDDSYYSKKFIGGGRVNQ